MGLELKDKMKNKVHLFKPMMSGKMRVIRYADDVSTSTGFYDCIRFEDYIEKEEFYCAKVHPTERDKQEYVHPELLDGRCKIKGMEYENKNCRGCSYLRHICDVGMLITCYKVITGLDDIKGKGQREFIGHRNYYVISADMVKDVLPLVEEGIGIIIYFPGTERMKVLKECTWVEVSKDIQIELLYAALKKWCEGKQE